MFAPVRVQVQARGVTGTGTAGIGCPGVAPREGALRRGKRKLEPQMHADEAGIDFGEASLTDRAGYRHQHAAICVHLRSSAVQILADSLPAMVVATCESRVILSCIH